MPKISRNVLSNKVYAAIKEMVANHRFQPGARLNVEKISKELEVSRTPVWEAVRRLQQEGLLQNIPYRGVFMVEMTLERALELYQVREALEGLAARLAAQMRQKIGDARETVQKVGAKAAYRPAQRPHVA